MTEGTTQLVANWITGVPRTRTARATRLAVDAMRDALGCIVAGSVEETPRAVLAAVQRWGSGPAHVVGTAAGLPSPWAALVNGASAHVLDYDDTFGPLSGHATAVLVPALLALGEELGSSGPDLLDALVVGLEVMACVGRGANPRHYALGWHATSTVGAVGAAGACARLMKLDATGARNALSLGVSMAAGTRMQLGAMAKSVHAGLAAKAGILAATLAASGVGGAEEALEGRWRFAEIFTAGRPAPAGAMLPPSDDAPLAIESPGLAVKAYPTCAATHLSLDALLALKARENFDAEEVESIETELPMVLRNNLIHENPRTGMEARFSMHYCLATAAAGGLGVADFEGDAIFRPEIRARMPRVVMRGLEETDGRPPPPTSVTLRLRDGRVLTETRTERRGSLANPLTAAEQEAKFRDCAAKLLKAPRIDAALAAIEGLATGGDARGLVASLSP